MTAAISSSQTNFSPEMQGLVERVLGTPDSKRAELIGALRRPDGSLAKVVQKFQSSNPEFFRSLLPELAPPVREAPADPTTDTSAFVNLVYETPQAGQKELKEEVDRPNGKYAKVVQQLQSSNLELFRSLFPEKASPAPKESKESRVTEADVEAFVNRIIDATQDQLAELRKEVWNHDGSLTELGQKMNADLRDAFFPQLDLSPKQAPSQESKSTKGYSIPHEVFVDLGLALGKLGWDANKCAPIKEKLVKLPGECKSSEEAMYAMSRLYTEELPPLLGDEWETSDLRRVLCNAISDLSLPDDEAASVAEKHGKRQSSDAPAAAVDEQTPKKSRAGEDEKRREATPSPSPQPSYYPPLPPGFLPSAQTYGPGWAGQPQSSFHADQSYPHNYWRRWKF
jgi:hypothetical protein